MSTGAAVIFGGRTAKSRAIVTPVLRSRRPRKEERGQRRHSGRSMSFMEGHMQGEEEEVRGLCNPAFLFSISPPMANYFSNHSSSRFLANSAQTTTTTTTTSHSAAAPISPAVVPRPRIPSSKHFSTTVVTTQPTASKDATASSTPSSTTATQVHPLRNTYVRILSFLAIASLLNARLFQMGLLVPAAAHAGQ